MAENNSVNSFNFVDILKTLWLWRKWLIILAVLAIVCSAVFSGPLFITPKYKSTIIFYPTTNNSTSNALLAEQNQRQKDPLEFGAEEEAEKALQILQSSKLTEKLARNFKLMEHYRINPNSKTKNLDLGLKIASNISFTRTRYLSILVEVLDENPKMAADLATGIANLYDSVMTDVQKQIAVPALKIVEKAVADKENEVNALKERMRKLGVEGVTNYEEQSRALAEEIYKARSQNKMALMESLVEQQLKLVQFGGDQEALREEIKLQMEKLTDLKAKADKARIDVNEALSHKFTVTDPSISEKKAYPVRWLIVFYTLFISMTVGSGIILIYENFKRNRA